MKKQFLLLLLVVASFSAIAQTSYTYRFASTPFASQPGGGPTLLPIDTIITPITLQVPKTTCPDTPIVIMSYFGHNSGFAAKSFFTHTYSIEMIFKFNEQDG